MNEMERIPHIETPRLVLTIPTPDDAHRLLRYALENREHLALWEPLRTDEYFTIEYWLDALSSYIKDFKAGHSLRLVLLDRADVAGPITGQCSFSQITRGPFQAAYLGYSLNHRAVGKGLMHEALTAAIGYAFEELNLHRLMANYVPANGRSGKLLRRLRFSVEGHARDYLRLAGSWQDHILTSLINKSWNDPLTPPMSPGME